MKNINNGAKRPVTNNFEFEQIRLALNLIRRKTYAILIDAEENHSDLDSNAKVAYNWLQSTSVDALTDMFKYACADRDCLNGIFSGFASSYVDNNPVEYTDEEHDIGYISFKDVYKKCPAQDQKVIARLFNIADLVLNANKTYKQVLNIVYD